MPKTRSTLRAVLLVAVIAVSGLGSPLATAHAASYTFTTLDVPGAMGTRAFEINDRGQIVGWFSDGTRNHGFLTDGATFTPIDVPGATYNFAFGINTAGQIVGGFSDGTTLHGFLTDGATFTPIDVPGASQTQGLGINDRGQIVGLSSDGTRNHGFLTDGATFTPIDVPGATHTAAFRINDRGQIVGWFTDATRVHGFLTDGATFTPIDVPGATETSALGINTAGQIVGYFRDATGDHGFVATPQVIVVTIDIKPGSEPAPINPKSQGVIPVAILTTDTFDATTVDPSSVLFGATGTEVAAVQSALEDVDGDGDLDMILHFTTQDTGIQCGDTSASLAGETADGQPIQGSDAIVTTGCKT